MSARIAVLLCISAYALSGCGTIANLSTGEPDLYGGVQKDIQLLQTPATPPTGIGIRNLGQLVLFVDLPLCFVGDTLTLPIAIFELQRGGPQVDTSGPGGSRGEGTPAPVALNGH
jgi:uncharacterized protein YceK